MRFIRKLDLKFANKDMEKEYTANKEKNIQKDLTVTINFLFILNLLIALPSLLSIQYVDLYVGSASIGVLILILCIRKWLKRYVQFLTFVVLLTYNVTRLVSVKVNFDETDKAILFLRGYAFALLQAIVLGRLHKIYQKIFGIAVAFILRIVLIWGLVHPGSFDVATLIRHFMLDVFFIYSSYYNEKTERNIFQNYYENREELLRFKELLSDSLPQSIMILDCSSKKPIFANKSFLDLFECQQMEYHTNNEIEITNADFTNHKSKTKISNLQVDPTNNKELEIFYTHNHSILSSNDVIYLNDIIEKLLEINRIREKPFSLTAFSKEEDQFKFFEVVLNRIKWDRNDVIAIILNDITYQRKLIALKMANSNKDRIIATVSHELRTPLNGILGLLELIQTRTNDNEVKEYLSLCKNRAIILLGLVNSLLDLNQASTGNLRVSLKTINLSELLNNTLELFEFDAKKKNIDLEIDLCEKPQNQIINDENKIQQILINLIANAIKFTPQGKIRIEVKQDPDHSDCLQISVIDTGIGIKEENKVNLFILEQNLEETKSVKKNGVGLGLTICNTLASVLSHNKGENSIKVESTFGQGSKFYFSLSKNLTNIKASNKKLPIHKISLSENKKSQKENLKDYFIFGDDTTHQRDNYFKSKPSENSLIITSDYEEATTPIELKITNYVSLTNRSNYKKNSLKIVTNEQKVEQKTIDEATDPIEKFTMPTEKSEMQQIDCMIKNIHPNNISTSFVVVVDDNPLNLMIAQSFIKSCGYSVKVALSGQEAIEILKKATKEKAIIKVVFMDCQMPTMDGYETTKILIDMMSKNEVQKVPILAWTANDSKEDIQRCYDCGMVDYIPKPSSKEKFLEILKRFDV